LGSFLAGIKAGTLTGIMYMGGIALFNVLLLVALKPGVLHVISQTGLCTGGTPTNSTGSLNDCFNLVLAYDVPFLAFVGFLIALFYSGVFGLFYDRFPGGTIIRGETIAGIVGLSLLIFGYSGFYFDYESALVGGIFFLAWTVVFGYVVGRLYKRYTRLVSFQSEDPESLKVSLDGRDVTGKARTLSLTSTHKLNANVSEGSSFKEWVSSGGVSLEDSRSFETTFEVNGDGLVKGRVGRKY
jgi:hypothetical protein